MDNVVLLKDAPNRDNALKFLDFLLEPANSATLTNWTQYSSGVRDVTPLLDEALRNSRRTMPLQMRLLVFLCRSATRRHNLSMTQSGQT